MLLLAIVVLTYTCSSARAFVEDRVDVFKRPSPEEIPPNTIADKEHARRSVTSGGITLPKQNFTLRRQ